MIKKDEWLRVKGPVSNIKEIKEISNNGTLLGELGHPDTFDVHLSNVSHRISNIQERNNKLYADIKILDTPKGNILKNIIIVDKSISFNARGTGNVDSNGNITDFKVFSFDAVPYIPTIIEERKDKLNKILKRMNDK